MFTTIKYNAELDEMQTARQTFDPEAARSNPHQACDRCHEKKVRCSGERTGCERCVQHELQCVYTRTGDRASRSASRRSHASAESSRGEARQSSTPSQSSRGETRRVRAPSQSLRGATPRHSARSSRSPPSTSAYHPSAGATAPVMTTAEDIAGIMYNLDAYLQPEDAFDMNLLATTQPASSAEEAYTRAAMVASSQPYAAPGPYSASPWQTQGYSGGYVYDENAHQQYEGEDYHQTDPRHWRHR